MDWFDKLPDTAKAAILGSAVAVGGVIVNSAVVAWNTARQLAHDRKQRALDRAQGLRREIILGAVEHLHAGLAAVVTYSDLTVPTTAILQDLERSAHFAAKIHLVASPDLLLAISDAHAAIATALVKLRFRRLKIERTERHIAEMERTGGGQNIVLPPSLTELQAVRMVLDKMSRDLAAFSLQEQARIAQMFIPIARAGRKELELAFDERVYTAIAARAEQLWTTADPELREVFGAELAPEAQAAIDAARQQGAAR